MPDLFIIIVYLYQQRINEDIIQIFKKANNRKGTYYEVEHIKK